MSDPIPPAAVVHCAFYVATNAGDGLFRYQQVILSNSDHDTYLPTPHPPSVDDLIWLWDTVSKSGGQFRVIERAWHHSAYCSANWPTLEKLLRYGPRLDIIVELADGPFRNEVPSGEEDSES